jgi:TetR/AcrR family transcriptional repressor of nem operon
MIARAIERAFVTVQERLENLGARYAPAEALREHVERYLSPKHRDDRGSSCPIATLSAHLAWLDEESRRAFERGAAALTSTMARLLEQAGHSDAGSVAVSVTAEMTGALSLSRVIADPARSDEVLRICRQSVLARVSPPRRGRASTE